MLKKNLLGLVMVVTLSSAIVLTGCGSTTNTAGQSTQSTGLATQTAAASTDETLAPVNLTWYVPFDAQKDQDSVMAEINKMVQKKINATLAIKMIPFGDYNNKMQVISAAGEEYDLTFTTSWTNIFTQNVVKGSLLPIDDLLAKYGKNILKDVPKQYWDAVKVNGKTYGIINYVGYSQSFGFTFKKDLVDKYKFDYKNAHSLKDIEPFLQKVKDGEPGIIPLHTGPTPGIYLNHLYTELPACLVYDGSTNKVVYSTNLKEKIEIYKTLKSFYDKGFIAKDAATKKDDQNEPKSGKYAVWNNGGVLNDGLKSSSVFGFPCVDSVYNQPMVATSSIQSALTGISKTSKNPERAMMLVNTIYEDKTLFNTMMFGVEGQNYTVVSGKGTDNPTIETKKDTGWLVWSTWFGNTFKSWPSNINNAEALESLKKGNENAKTSPLLGFNFDSSIVKNEIAQINAINSESSKIFTTGSSPDPEKYANEILDRMKAAGIDKVKDELQKQIDEWRKANGK